MESSSLWSISTPTSLAMRSRHRSLKESPQRVHRRGRAKAGESPWHEVALAALVIAGLIVGGVFFFRNRTPQQTAAAPNASSSTAVGGAIPEKSIAVLPFENRSEEKANAYFADGIQDEILTRLS